MMYVNLGQEGLCFVLVCLFVCFPSSFFRHLARKIFHYLVNEMAGDRSGQCLQMALCYPDTMTILAVVQSGKCCQEVALKRTLLTTVLQNALLLRYSETAALGSHLWYNLPGLLWSMQATVKFPGLPLVMGDKCRSSRVCKYGPRFKKSAILPESFLTSLTAFMMLVGDAH